MVFLFYKFLFFLSDFLEIQRKSFYLFLNELLSQEFLKIQPLWFRRNPSYKNILGRPPTQARYSGTGSGFERGWSGKYPVAAGSVADGISRRGATLEDSPSLPTGLSKATAITKKNDPIGARSLGRSYKTLTYINNTFEDAPSEPIQKISPMTTNDRITTIYFLSKNYKFIKPILNIEESILFSKTYCCNFYMPVQLFDHSINSNEMRWIFLGTLPLLTRRGHFIINGTPRIILNQIVRSPGIYFHKETTEEKKNSRLFYAEIISKNGPWVRLEIDQRKKIWVSCQQIGLSRISLSHFFEFFFSKKKLDHHIFLNEKKKKKLNLDAILFNEFFWKDVFFKEPKNEIDVYTYPNVHLDKATMSDHRNDQASRPLGGWSSFQFQKLWPKYKRFKMYRPQNLYRFFSSKKYQRLNWGLFIYLKFSKKFNHSVQNYKNTKWLQKTVPVLSSLRGTSCFGLGENTRAIGDVQMNRQMFDSSVQHPQKQKSKWKRGSECDILFASSSKYTDLGFHLGRLGRIRLNKRLGLSLKTFTLTPIDFLAISDILYRFVKGGLPFDGNNPNLNSIIFLDDIDNLKNRRLKTIGELLQNQLARGLQRLQKTFENTVQKDWIKFLNHQTYNSSLAFLNFFNLNRKKIGPLGPLAAKKTLHSISQKSFEASGVHSKAAHSAAQSPSDEARWRLTPNRLYGESYYSLDHILRRTLQKEKKGSQYSAPKAAQAGPIKKEKKNTLDLWMNDQDIFKRHILEKRNFYLQQIRKLNMDTGRPRTFGYRLQFLTSLISQKQFYSLLTKLHFKRNFLWKELLLYQKKKITLLEA